VVASPKLGEHGGADESGGPNQSNFHGLSSWLNW
jgi:hypothetical protein